MAKNKWETHIVPNLLLIERWAGRGFSAKEISHNLGISQGTLRRYAKEHKELAAAMKKKGSPNPISEPVKRIHREVNIPKTEQRGSYAPAGTNIVPRPDRNGTHRGQFEKNKKRVYATQTVCGICGKPVDMAIKYPDPMSKCIDHIIPIARGGHPSDIANLQLAHWICNRLKSDKITKNTAVKCEVEKIGNRILPQSRDWSSYRA